MLAGINSLITCGIEKKITQLIACSITENITMKSDMAAA